MLPAADRLVPRFRGTPATYETAEILGTAFTLFRKGQAHEGQHAPRPAELRPKSRAPGLPGPAQPAALVWADPGGPKGNSRGSVRRPRPGAPARRTAAPMRTGLGLTVPRESLDQSATGNAARTFEPGMRAFNSRVIDRPGVEYLPGLSTYSHTAPVYTSCSIVEARRGGSDPHRHGPTIMAPGLAPARAECVQRSTAPPSASSSRSTSSRWPDGAGRSSGRHS